MPLQNRVLPNGDIVAIEARGTFTGNRGIIHNPVSKTLLRRRWSSRAWICCSLEFKGKRRRVMSTGTWTELFFLDEATALAAGHRPCYFCRREDAKRFAEAFAAGNGMASAKAGQMDEILHRERMASGGAAPALSPADAAQLPPGAIVEHSGEYYLIGADKAWRWRPDGYGSAVDIASFDSAATTLVTPPVTCNALRAGYRPELHRSLARLERFVR